MITKDATLTLTCGTVLYHRTARNADGTALRCRVSGACKVWKTRPEDFRLPVKHGLRHSLYLTPANAEDWLLSDPTADTPPAGDTAGWLIHQTFARPGKPRLGLDEAGVLADALDELNTPDSRRAAFLLRLWREQVGRGELCPGPNTLRGGVTAEAATGGGRILARPGVVWGEGASSNRPCWWVSVTSPKYDSSRTRLGNANHCLRLSVWAEPGWAGLPD